MREILERRCEGLAPDQELFTGVSADHLCRAAMHVGSPRFMLHDLRKMLATVGERVGVGDAVLRRILNHTAPKSDALHRHYVSVGLDEVGAAMVRIQGQLAQLMGRVNPVPAMSSVRT
jgi:hypothetical protein